MLLNEIDLVDADSLGRVEDRIRKNNPYAGIIRTERCGAVPTCDLRRARLGPTTRFDAV